MKVSRIRSHAIMAETFRHLLSFSSAMNPNEYVRISPFVRVEDYSIKTLYDANYSARLKILLQHRLK